MISLCKIHFSKTCPRKLGWCNIKLQETIFKPQDEGEGHQSNACGAVVGFKSSNNVNLTIDM